MNDRIIDILIEIRDRYGDMILYNQQKTKNLLNDLAPGLKKERIHICQFLDLNGYFQLKYAGHSYPIIRARLVQSYSSTYGVNESVANWVLDVFSEILGFSDFKNLDKIIVQDEELEPIKIPEKPETPEKLEIPKVPKAADLVELIPKPKKVLPPPPPPPPKKKAFDLKKRISADMHSVAILPNGHVVAVGPNDDGQCNVGKWRNIQAVSAGPFFTVGLQEDGRVVATGRNDHGQCNVSMWRHIVAISAGARHTLGLRSDGTMVATGQNRNGECNVENWRNVIHISAGYLCSFAIKKDHKVLAKGNIKGAKLSVEHLSNVADILNPYPYRAIALKRDGSLLTVSKNEEADALQKSLSKWKGVKQVSAGPDYFAGLFKDGTVRILAYYWISSGIECNPDDWMDIAAIAAGRFHLIGVRNDGTMVATMMHPRKAMNKGQCRVRDWRLI